ncbi:FecR family protein [Flavitalea flava]
MQPNHSYYRDFTVEQLAADEYFQEWVLQPDSSKDRFWSDYLQRTPHQQEPVIKARQLVIVLAAGEYSIQPLSFAEKRSIKENIYQQLDLPLSGNFMITEQANAAGGSTFFDIPPVYPGLFGQPRKKSWLKWSAAAAALTALVIPAYLLIKPGKKDTLLIVRTGYQEMKRIILPDSTVILLNPNSSLQYSSNFPDAASREVSLEGNAFFKVRKDPGVKKFVVHAHDLSITVLGTEFNVNARTPATEIELTSGKIKLALDDKKGEEAYMVPGDKIKLDPVKRDFIKTSTDTELYSAWTQGKWNFRKTRLEEITALIHEYYGVDVVFKNDKSKRLRINAEIQVSSLQKLIPVLAETLKLKMTLQNNQLIIY